MLFHRRPITISFRQRLHNISPMIYPFSIHCCSIFTFHIYRINKKGKIWPIMSDWISKWFHFKTRNFRWPELSLFHLCLTFRSLLNIYLYMGVFLSLHFKLLPAIQVLKLEKRIAMDARRSDDGEKLYMLSVYRCLKCHHCGTELIIIYNHTTFVISASRSRTSLKRLGIKTNWTKLFSYISCTSVWHLCLHVYACCSWDEWSALHGKINSVAFFF